VEPVGNTGGIITPTPEYFQILREICDRYNIILIFDEVITGFGKTGAMFAAQTYGVTPDIICCGKGLSSGMLPIGAMIAREDMAEAFWGTAADNVQFAHGHTFAGNPLASAVGMAVIDEIVENGLILRVDPCWFAVAPALIASESELDEMCGLIEKSLVEAMAQVAQLCGHLRAVAPMVGRC
jgi:adenosylmethionine-8-amino-7-oxononanoate aminotransferase